MKNSLKIIQEKRRKRARRVRAKIVASSFVQPRLSVFRSNQHIYGQLIDGQKGVTLVSASDLELKELGRKKRVESAREVGLLLARKASARKITEVVFDKGGYKYHGIVKSLAEGAREGGLKF